MQAIERTFSILGALAEQPERAGISEIARRTDLPTSTTSRILARRESLGLVERIGDQSGFGAALATLTPGATPIGSLRDLARPQLVELADALGENTSLVVDDGDLVINIDTAMPSDQHVQVQDWTGVRVPFHAAAAGIALMSTWDDARLAEFCAGGLEAFTDETVTTLGGLRHKLETLRRSGVVWTVQEFADDVTGIGAPIIGPDGEAVGAINVYGPAYRFPGEQASDEIAAAVIDACTRIATRFAGD